MKSELEEAEEWVDKEYPWLRKSVRAGEWNTLSTVAFEKAHRAGQSIGEKRGYLRALDEVEREAKERRLIRHDEDNASCSVVTIPDLEFIITKLKEGA